MQPIAPVTIADLLAPTPLPRCKFEVYDGANWLDFCSLGGKCYVKKDGISFSLGGAGMSPDPIAATWSAEIHNEDGKFHPFHPTSEYKNLFRIGREVRISLGGIFKKFPAPFEAWSSRKRIDLPLPTANLTDFPEKVPIVAGSPASIAIGAACRADGFDLRFTAADGVTLLPYERESFAVAGGEATGIFWVKTNVATAGTYIWLYYGNPAGTDVSNGPAVFGPTGSDYAAVYHMNDATTSTISDSTGNANNGAKKGANEPVEADGKIGKGQDFDGTDDYINCGSGASLDFGTGSFTVSGLVKQDATSGNYAGIVTRRGGAGGYYQICGHSDGTLNLYLSVGLGLGVPMSTGVWHYFVVIIDRTANLAKVSIDNGAFVTGDITGMGSVDNAAPTRLGWEAANDTHFDGLIDEVHISSIARSAAWLAYEYANMNPADGGLTWGAEESPQLPNYSKYWQRLIGYMDAPRFDHGTRTVSLSGMDRMKRLADTVLREVLDTPAYGPLHWGALATFDSKAGGGGTGAEIYAEADACEIGAGEANNVTNWAEGGSGGSTASVASTKSNYALEFTRDAPGPTAQYTHNANVGAAIAGNRYTVKFWGRISVGDNYAVLMIYQTIGGVATLIGQQNIGLNGNAWTFYSKVVSITAGGALQFRVNTGGKYATATDAVQVDNISIQIYDPNYWNHYDLPVATSRGPYYVTLNGEPLWQGDAALVENAEKKPGWSYNEETAILTLTDDLAINAGTANLKVYYYTDQSLDNVLADLLVAAGYYANRAAALAAMDYTPTGITIPRVWFEPDSTALAAVKLICGRADYRLWFDEDGVPCFKPNPTATPPPPPTGATYYVDALTGNDGNNGLSPATAWKTLSKVNAAALAPDDRVLFKRGETWAEELKPTSGGTSGHPVIFGAYGVGTPPKITGATRALDTNSKNYLTFRGLIFTDKEVLATGSTGTSLEYCLLRDSNANGFKALNAPLTALKNCLVIGARDDGVLSDGATAVIDLKNTIVVANGGGIAGQTYGGGGLNTVNGGTINYSYSNITGNGYRPDWNVRGGSGGTNNQLQVLPKMERPMKDAAFFTVTIDDTGYAYAQAAAAAIEPYGGKLTFFVIPSLIDAAGQTALAALAAAGHEIAVHSWSHADLTQSLAFDISSTNTFPTIDIDVPTTTILLWCDEVGNRVTFNWAGNKTIGDLKAAAAGKGWTINNVGTIQDALRLACLHDSAGPQYLPTNGWLDVEEPNYMFWDQEINGARDWIESLTGIKPKTMAYPFGSTHALLQTWLKDQGYEGARGTNDILQTLSDIEIYNNRNGHDLKGDGSEAQVKDRAKHYFELSKQTARMLCFYVHNTGELSPTQWGWIAQELAASGTQLQTFGSYVSAIRASHTPSGDGLTYTKTYPDVFNPHLKPASPCINAGFSVGLDEDIEGTPAPQAGTYDIGAYEFLMATPASPTFEGKDLQGCSFFQDLGTVRNRIVVEGIEQGMFATREEKKRSRLTGEASDPSSIEAYLEKTHSVKNHLFQDQASIDTMVAVLLATWKDPKHYAVLDLFANSVPLELGDTIGVKLLLQKVGEIEYYADRSAIIRDISIGGDTATYKVEIEP